MDTIVLIAVGAILLISMVLALLLSYTLLILDRVIKRKSESDWDITLMDGLKDEDWEQDK